MPTFGILPDQSLILCTRLQHWVVRKALITVVPISLAGLDRFSLFYQGDLVPAAGRHGCQAPDVIQLGQHPL